jgi:hypothetical protein
MPWIAIGRCETWEPPRTDREVRKSQGEWTGSPPGGHHCLGLDEEAIKQATSPCGVAEASPRLEIRLIGDRGVIVEQMLVVLSADVFDHLLLNAPVTSLAGPGLIESVRVFDGEGHFHHLTVVD